MFKRPVLKVVYFRTVVCLLIFLSISVVKFIPGNAFNVFKDFYELNFKDELNIDQVFEDKPAASVAPKKENNEVSPQTNVSDTPLTKLSAGNIGMDFCIPITEYDRISSDYGYRYNPVTGKYAIHEGIDFAADEGIKIFAAEDGVVNKSMLSSDLGYFIQINHGNGIYTTYAHCSKLLVEVDQKVAKGDAIALVGSTGQSTGPHLHFEIKINSSILNPIYYLPIDNNA